MNDLSMNKQGFVPSTRSTLQYMTLIACLAALCIVSRIYLAGFPNVKPVTTIIIVASIVYGIRFGLTLVTITVIGSNLILGMGMFVVMQLIAWGMVAIVAGLLGRIYKMIPHWIMAIFAGLAGFLFGIMVSLNMLIIGGPIGFFTYWLGGLPFDLTHAVSNFFFYLILAPTLLKLLETQKKKMNHSNQTAYIS